MGNLNIFRSFKTLHYKFLGKQGELALKWKRGFQNHFKGFCVSHRGGGEYLFSSQWWQRIAILLDLSTILLFQSIFLKCNLVETRQGGQISDII